MPDLTPLDLEELKRLAEAATPGPWTCQEGSTSYPECDDKDFWAAVLSPNGRDVITLYERYGAKNDDRKDYDFDAAFIAAANPATVLSLINQIEGMRAALEPFAREADTWSDQGLESEIPLFVAQSEGGSVFEAQFSLADLLRARQALSTDDRGDG